MKATSLTKILAVLLLAANLVIKINLVEYCGKPEAGATQYQS